MDKYLRPERFEGDPSQSTAAAEWEHWKKTFNNFLAVQVLSSDQVKLNILINHLSPNVYNYISECQTYEQAIRVLDGIYVKPKNILYARHALATRKQNSEETIDTYIQALKQLSKDCDFTAVDGNTNRDDNIRDAFIAGISSTKIRERLLENLSLTLDEAHNQARSLEMAEVNTLHYSSTTPVNATIENIRNTAGPSENTSAAAPALRSNRKCFFCGGRVHPRKTCPSFDASCQLCNKKGHFANVCRSKNQTSAAISDTNNVSSSIVAASPSSLRRTTMPTYINGIKAEVLLDTGSAKSFMDSKFAKTCSLTSKPSQQTISMASLSHSAPVAGEISIDLTLGKHSYENLRLLLVEDLCSDVIIGLDVLAQHSSIAFDFGGPREPLVVCHVSAASVPAVPLFANLTPGYKPIAIKSRRYSDDDRRFIEEEIKNLLKEGIIEESRSPWRAQVLITKSTTHKKRLVIDYSRTINQYTELDAYPLPCIEELISKVAKYSVFSAIDLKSAYHQVPILPEERHFTAFEAAGNLYQFRRIPFGVTNGVSSFQRTIDWLIRTENLAGTFAYLDDITICGKSPEEHDTNLQNFMTAAKKYGLTLNETKSIFKQSSINILGYTIANNVIKPDSARLEPLLNLPPPHDLPSMRRAMGMFAHYSKWIPNFSEKVHELAKTKTFPLTNTMIKDFGDLKNYIVKSCVHAIDDNVPFTVETDASEHSIAATLSQAGRPVAFYSRTLNQSEQNHSAIEKEAYAIVESLKKWRHFLIGKLFLLITDQRSVSFMFDKKHTSKIKNEKIQRWRLELSPYKYDIVYRPGTQNHVADALSRVCAIVDTPAKLQSLHEALCHPGVTRMAHWVRSKNLAYSIEEIRNMTNQCRICLQYILTVIDEYSRFPFAFPCSDISAKTVIKHLDSIFTMFGMPAYVHSDRGTSFLSDEVKDYFNSRGVATSRTTPYNPRGNGQVEKLNGTLWKSIQLALKSRNLPIECWEDVLPQALHSIRSLLCTTTNCTPHERMFRHPRKSPNGESIPTWLTSSNKVLMRRFNRKSKYQPLVEEVEVIETNPTYSYVRTEDGRETTVSNRHLAPLGCCERNIPGDNEYVDNDPERAQSPPPSRSPPNTPNSSPTRHSGQDSPFATPLSQSPSETLQEVPEPPSPDGNEPAGAEQPRRSGRIRNSPKYLSDYIWPG
ncbi:uncharacterized protein LOC134797361 [Cydia splendana]|uniref:uncharacterized protein LOC134797361 n=1 Tax=Cydia splendana TaxID=1100963 RepID=UPI00300CE002